MKRRDIKIYLVDDSGVFVDALAGQLSSYDDLVVAGHGVDVESSLDEIEKCRPDVVVIDFWLKGGKTGVDGIAEVSRRWPAISCVLMSNELSASKVKAAIGAGARGCISKFTNTPDLVAHAVRTVFQGNNFFDEESHRFLFEALSAPKGKMLTSKEEQVLWLKKDGLSNAEVAARLGISEGTVKTHVQKVRSKLGVENVGKAIARWQRSQSEYADFEVMAVRRLVELQLAHKFGTLPAHVNGLLLNASREDLESWGLRLLDCNALDDVFVKK